MPITVDGQRVLLASSAGEIDRSQVVSVTLSMIKPNVAQASCWSASACRTASQRSRLPTATWWTPMVNPRVRAGRKRSAATNNSRPPLPRSSNSSRRGWPSGISPHWINTAVNKGPAFDASGFFRTEKRDGRWYLETPEGHPFYSLGVNTVAFDNNQTYVAGREWMFGALPQAGEPFDKYYGSSDHRTGNGVGEGRSFAAGAGTISTAPTCSVPTTPMVTTRKRWISYDRLQAWGFNTIGNWSAADLASADRVPYTLPLSIVGDYASISTGTDWWGGMPDLFDPRSPWPLSAAAIAARDHRDDPWLIWASLPTTNWPGRPR